MNMSKKFFIVLSLFSFLSLGVLNASAMPISHQHRGFENRYHHERIYQAEYRRSPRVDVHYNYNYNYRHNHQTSSGAIVTGGILGGIIGALIGASL